MKFAVVGAGAIGGYLGARLALAGHDVTFIARGANLEAIKARGFTLIAEDGTREIAASAKASAIQDAGPCDVVLLAVKAQQVAGLAPELRRLFAGDTIVVTLQNGVPWWFFHQFGGAFEGRIIEAVDPGGTIGRSIENERVIGTVVYPASTLVSPGVVKVIEGNRFTLGEAGGAKSPRILALSQALTEAQFKAPVSSDIRSEIWLKLMGNVVFNPISALSRATLVEICRYAPTRALAAAMMTEAQSIAEKLGLRIRISIDKRIAGAEAVGAHKTSMLQDLEAGRPLELDALVGSLVELAQMTATPIPATEAIFAATSLLDRTMRKP